jgi:FixJ family two-component response regulator
MTSVTATIHIVDDDASFRTSTGRLLRACGYAVETYASAEELLNRLPNGAAPGCILRALAGLRTMRNKHEQLRLRRRLRQ